MSLLAFMRHVPTTWSEEGRLQGRADVPPLRYEQATAWRAPPEFLQYRWLSSPLERCKATARRLGVDAAIEPRLIEMDWGEWEGQTLVDLRARLGDAMAAEEAKGLDFCPPGGESPRDVQARIEPLLAEIAASGRTTVAVTHKGVIRAASGACHRLGHARQAALPPVVVGGASVQTGGRRASRSRAAQHPAGARAAVKGRVLFHVQYLLGIGHLQRSLRIAEALIERGLAVTLVQGGPPMPEVSRAQGIDVVQLPPIRARDATFALVDERGNPVDDDLRAVRRERLLAALPKRCGRTRW